MLGKTINIIRNIKGAVLNDREKTDLEVNTEKTKYTIRSCHQTIGQVLY
jgi:hypothetical protein